MQDGIWRLLFWQQIKRRQQPEKDGRKSENIYSKEKADKKQEENFTMEVILWVVVAVSLLLFISNFGVGGTIGNAVSRFFFGVFGLLAYVFPIVLLTGTFFAVSNKGNQMAVVKLVASVLFSIFMYVDGAFSASGKQWDGRQSMRTITVMRPSLVVDFRRTCIV